MANQELQAWFETMNKKLDNLEPPNAGDMSIDSKLKNIDDLSKDWQSGQMLLSNLMEKADHVSGEIGPMDKQHLDEQTGSSQRRMKELKKKIERKKQIIELAHNGYKDTKKEIEKTDQWMKEKIAFLQNPNKGDMGKRLEDVLALSKEIDAKHILLDSLDVKVSNVRSDLNSSEVKQLESCLKMLSTNQNILSKLAKEVYKKENSMLESKKRLGSNLDVIKAWLDGKASELFPPSEFEPLKAFVIEKRVSKYKKSETEIRNYEEKEMTKVRQEFSLFEKSKDNEKNKYLSDLKDVEAKFENLKKTLNDKKDLLEGKLESRRQFESDLQSSIQWLNKAESISSSEIRGSINIASLDEHLQKFKGLKTEEEANRKLLTSLVERANEIIKGLSDADQLNLQSEMDNVCDKMNQVSDTTKRRVEDLIKNIEQYRKTATKIEQSVTYLSTIQREIKQLNKPIGYKVEDAEDVLDAYEKILADLRSFKEQLEELQKTTGTNVNELKVLLQQQEELIAAIESQMQKIKSLINVRHNFMEIVTDITGFIIKYTEVVKEIERSDISSAEKVKKYDEAIHRIEECETQLAVATDKGLQIAAEGSSADRNKITEQLHSLKTQILNLKKAIEGKRNEHMKYAADHERLLGSVETHLDWLHSKEAEAKSRPLLSTNVEEVDRKIHEHTTFESEVTQRLDEVRRVKENVLKEGSMSGMVENVLNLANALLHSMPIELKERKQYLEQNRNHRLEYDSLVERLHSWVEEAQQKLRSTESGVDFMSVQKDLEEHTQYFGPGEQLQELLAKIHESANSIWPSLDQHYRDKVAQEQDFFSQLVKNIQNSAQVKQAQLTEHSRKWKTFRETYTVLSKSVASINFDLDKPTSLAGVKSTINKIDSYNKTLQQKKRDLEKYNDMAKDLLTQADGVNKHNITREQTEINETIQKATARLKDEKEALATLALGWDDFDLKSRSFSSAIANLQHKVSTVDTTFRSVHQMKEMKKSLQVLINKQNFDPWS